MSKQTVFAIGIPTINRADLLQETLEKYQYDFPNTNIFVVDNGMQYFDFDRLSPNVHFIVNDKNVGVSESWNQLLDKIYNGIPGFSDPCQKALILNDDIYLGKNEKEMLSFIETNIFPLAKTTGTWCTFILDKLVYFKVGNFDNVFFPAYFEDNDYDYRLKLSGFISESYSFLDPVIYRNSQSIAKDKSLNNNFEINKRYYIQKWGGEPLKETYLAPFNQL